MRQMHLKVRSLANEESKFRGWNSAYQFTCVSRGCWVPAQPFFQTQDADTRTRLESSGVLGVRRSLRGRSLTLLQPQQSPAGTQNCSAYLPSHLDGRIRCRNPFPVSPWVRKLRWTPKFSLFIISVSSESKCPDQTIRRLPTAVPLGVCISKNIPKSTYTWRMDSRPYLLIGISAESFSLSTKLRAESACPGTTGLLSCPVYRHLAGEL